ncbi:MAG: zinc-dependent alcohol dehydrogenase [Hyphomicrobiales bacterium]
MKALVYKGPELIELADVERPRRGNESVVVQIGAVGICGSDMHAYLGHDERRPPPLILGHEAAGEIVEGPGKGRRVTINPLVSCGKCRACHEGRDNVCPDRQIMSMPPREGVFAEFATVHERNFVELPDGLTTEQAALAEPLSCSYHGVRLISEASFRPLAEASAVVLGGGAIGLGAALCLADCGCSDIWIAETNKIRHRALDAAGDFKVYDPVRSANTAPHDADVVIDAFGGPATRSAASQLVRPGGVILHIGLAGGDGGFDTRHATLQEITFIGSYTYTAHDFRQCVAAMAAGRLGALDWFETRPLEDGPAAFRDINAGKVSMPKVILHP